MLTYFSFEFATTYATRKKLDIFVILFLFFRDMCAVWAGHLELELSEGLHEGHPLDVANGAAQLCVHAAASRRQRKARCGSVTGPARAKIFIFPGDELQMLIRLLLFLCSTSS